MLERLRHALLALASAPCAQAVGDVLSTLMCGKSA